MKSNHVAPSHNKNDKTMSTIKLIITEIKYEFYSDGSVIPHICVSTDIYNNATTHRIPYNPNVFLDHNFGKGDIIEATIDSSAMIKSIKLVSVADVERRDLSAPYCPVCGRPLFPSQTGVGKCINRSCRAQMTYSVYRFIEEIGVDMSALKRPMNALLSRGAFHTVLDLFYFTLDDFIMSGLVLEEFLLWQKHTVATRKFISTREILRGIYIPGVTTSDIDIIVDFFNQHGLEPLHLGRFLMSEEFRSIPISWGSIDAFLSIPENVELLNQLSRTLL